MKHSVGNILGISDFLLLLIQIHLLTVQSKYCGGTVGRSPKSSQILTLVPGVPIILLHLCVYRLHCSHVMAYFVLIRQWIGKWAVTVGSWQRGTLLWYHKDLAVFLYWVSREDTNISLRDVPLKVRSHVSKTAAGHPQRVCKIKSARKHFAADFTLRKVCCGFTTCERALKRWQWLHICQLIAELVYMAQKLREQCNIQGRLQVRTDYGDSWVTGYSFRPLLLLMWTNCRKKFSTLCCLL